MNPPILQLLLLTLCALLLAVSKASASSETQPASTSTQYPTSGANDNGGRDGDTSDGQADVNGNNKPSAEAIAVFIVVVSMVTGLCWIVGEVVMCEVRRYRRDRAEHQRQEGPEIEMTDMGARSQQGRRSQEGMEG